MIYLLASGSGAAGLYWHSTASWVNPTSSTSGPGVGATVSSFQPATSLPGPNDDVYLVAPWRWATNNFVQISMRALNGLLQVNRIYMLTTGSWGFNVAGFQVIDTIPGVNVFNVPNDIIGLSSAGSPVGCTFVASPGSTLNITGSLYGGDGQVTPAFTFSGIGPFNISGSLYMRAAPTQTGFVLNTAGAILNIDGDVIYSGSGNAGTLNVSSNYQTVTINGNVANLATSNALQRGPAVRITDLVIGSVVNIRGVVSRDYKNQLGQVVGQTTKTVSSNVPSAAINIHRPTNYAVSNVLILGSSELPFTYQFSGTQSLIISDNYAGNATSITSSIVDRETTVFIYAGSTFNTTTSGSKTPVVVPKIYITSSNIAVATASVTNPTPYSFGKSDVSDPTPVTSDVYAGVVYGLSDSKTGVLTTPSSSHVRSTITYSSGSIGSTPSSTAGTTAMPPQNDVRIGIRYDTAPSGGRMVVPIASQVSASLTFDSDNKTGTYSGKEAFWATPHTDMTTGIGQQISQSLNTHIGTITGSLIGLLDTDTSNVVTRLRSIAGVADVGNALTQSANI